MLVFCKAKSCIYNEEGVCVKRAITLEFNLWTVWSPECRDYQLLSDEEEEIENPDSRSPLPVWDILECE